MSLLFAYAVAGPKGFCSLMRCNWLLFCSSLHISFLFSYSLLCFCLSMPKRLLLSHKINRILVLVKFSLRLSIKGASSPVHEINFKLLVCSSWRFISYLTLSLFAFLEGPRGFFLCHKIVPAFFLGFCGIFSLYGINFCF